MSVDLTKGATVELVKTLSDDLRTKDDNTKYSSAGAAMRDKANVDGYYENLVSGGSEQLLSSVYEEDSEPYLFRTSGGSMDIGDREEDTIVGGTVVWNQLLADANFTDTAFPNGATSQYDSTTDSVSYSATISTQGYGYVQKQNFGIKKDHIYLLQFNVEATNANYVWGKVDSAGDTPASHAYAAGTHAFIQKSSRGTSGYGNSVLLGISANNGTGVTATFSKPQIFDLTQMFGTTIADYIYSLETANAGAGVAWFRKLFNKPYYEYNAGTLKSVEGLQSHDMVGFNAWDEEWEMGDISSSNGANYSSTAYWRTKNYIKILPNTIYRVTAEGISSSYAIRQRFYDADKNFLGVTTGGGSQYITTGSTFRTPVNACYMRFAPDASNVPAGTKMCINLHWDGERDGEYEPYVKYSYPLDDSLTLRGIPKLDSANKLYYDGDVYEADGIVTRKYGIVDLGTLNWSSGSGNTHFYTTFSDAVNMNGVSAICPAFINHGYLNNGWASLLEGEFSIYNQTLRVSPATSYTDAAAFKTAMSGVYLVYELATPTTEEAEPYQTPQIVDDFGTEEYVTDSIVPVGHETKYQSNLRAKLEMSPDSPSDNGDYIVRHTNGQNEYVPLVIPTELPAMPTDNGTYRLKVTVSNGTATLSWESAS